MEPGRKDCLGFYDRRGGRVLLGRSEAASTFEWCARVVSRVCLAVVASGDAMLAVQSRVEHRNDGAFSDKVVEKSVARVACVCLCWCRAVRRRVEYAASK